MYRDTSSVDCAPRELTHACSGGWIVGEQIWNIVRRITVDINLYKQYTHIVEPTDWVT